jgi:RimJ/RimL family protein N-acetyltransferase
LVESTSTSVQVRHLSSADVNAYRQLRLRALKESPESFATTYEEYVRRSIADEADRLTPTPDCFTLGAFLGDRLVGSVTFIRQTRRKTVHKASLVGMYVAPEYRRRGIGRALVAEFLRLAAQQPGLEQIQLTVVATNDAARRLYESFGFRIFGTEPRAMKHDDTYWDEHYMRLELDSTI